MRDMKRTGYMVCSLGSRIRYWTLEAARKACEATQATARIYNHKCDMVAKWNGTAWETV